MNGDIEAMACNLNGRLLKWWRARSHSTLRDVFDTLCRTLEIDALIECGAHNAEASRRFLHTRPTGVAIALEANPFTFAARTMSADLDGVTPLNLGVGAVPGKVVLLIPNDDRVDLPTPGNASFSRRTDSTSTYVEVEVTVTTVDEVAAAYAPGSTTALWIDVEGHGHQVLQGARETLKSGRCRLIFVEVEELEFWQGQALQSEVKQLLAEFGFKPIARDAEYPHQFNVVYVARDYGERAAPAAAAYWRSVVRGRWRLQIQYNSYRIRRKVRAGAVRVLGARTAQGGPVLPIRGRSPSPTATGRPEDGV